MLKGPFLSKNWIGALEDYNEARVVMLGLPFDSTVSNKGGTRFAPSQIRLESWGLEDYSPHFDSHLEDVKFYDAGDLELPFGNSRKTLDIIAENTFQVLESGKKFFGVGGEHLVTLGAIEAYSKKYENLAVVHFDAHTDLREELLGEKYTHSGVMKQISNIVSMENILQIGIRSGLKEEFDLVKKYNSLIKTPAELLRFKDKNIFISLDLDVLDPSLMPGTGTPEAGGLSYKELISYFDELKKYNIVGADVVELSPDYDSSKASTAVAAKVIRELLMIM